jgi:hypothetical protein
LGVENLISITIHELIMADDSRIAKDLWLAWYEKVFRYSAHKVLLDTQKIGWTPGYQDLEAFCKETYREIVDMYTELEETQEYPFTQELLTAVGCRSNKDLAFCVGEGFTRSESSATHGIGWGLQGLLDSQKANPEPFDLKLLIVGYETLPYLGIGGGGGGKRLPKPSSILPVEEAVEPQRIYLR